MPRPTLPLVLLLLAAAPAAGAAQTAQTMPSWLAGCWRRSAGDRVTDEQWMAPRAGLMLGMARGVRGEQVRLTERLSIHLDPTGRLVYTALPSGQAEASFPAVVVSDTLLLFENPEHDDPKRIGYRRVGADSVVATAEGDRVVTFPMARVRCEG